MNEGTQDRLYIAVRSDLSPGSQLAQVAHAGIQFALEHPEVTARWNADSNNVVIVGVSDMQELMVLGSRARQRDVDMTLVIEPDLDNELTAIAMTPGKPAARVCASIPLAGRVLVPG